MVVLDQFEEVFTTVGDAGERDAFIARWPHSPTSRTWSW
jgi:hypothetical protein